MTQRADRQKAMVQRIDSQLQRARRRLYRLEALGLLEERGRKPSLPVRFRAQFGEDLALWELFDDQVDGFFIEVGAFDGVELSVSYVFEAIGWRGLLIEALPERYEQCVKNRPGSRVVHGALSRDGSSGTTTFESVEGEGEAPLFSFLGGSREHLKRVREREWETRKTVVPLTSMNALLEGHRGPIDFAVIDVEGAEIPLLQGFDLNRYRPRVLLIEDNAGRKGRELPAYMSAFAYTEVGWVGVNRLYVRSDERALIKRFHSA